MAGLADQLRERGFAVFGPGADGARLEGSKAFAKEVMDAAGVPTGRRRHLHRVRAGAGLSARARGARGRQGRRAGRRQGRHRRARPWRRPRRRWPSASWSGASATAADTVLIEEFLEGEEVSLLSIVSGQQILPLAPAQDYKRALDGDAGPNTGGMGSYSPGAGRGRRAVRASWWTTVVRPTVAELVRRGIDFRGVLYAGLMLTAERAQGARVQLPLRRSGDPGPAAPARVATCWSCCGRRPPAASCLPPRPGGAARRGRGHGFAGLSGLAAPRATSSPVWSGVRASRRRAGVPRGHQGRRTAASSPRAAGC